MDNAAVFGRLCTIILYFYTKKQNMFPLKRGFLSAFQKGLLKMTFLTGPEKEYYILPGLNGDSLSSCQSLRTDSSRKSGTSYARFPLQADRQPRMPVADMAQAV